MARPSSLLRESNHPDRHPDAFGLLLHWLKIDATNDPATLLTSSGIDIEKGQNAAFIVRTTV